MAFFNSLASPGSADGSPHARQGLQFSRLVAAIAHRASARALAAKSAFVVTVVYAGLLFWLAPHPPMADLPQHAGQVALLRELLFGQSSWEPLLRINYFTPYLIGYGLTVPLSFVMPIADAMKLLLMLAFYGFVSCCVLLRRHFHGDERLDWLFIPGFLGFSYVFGFFTFLLAAPVALLFILLADRYAQHPTSTDGVRLAGVGLVLFFSHGLAFLFASSIGVALLLFRVRRWPDTLLALLPYAPLAALSIGYAAASHYSEAATGNEPSGTLWGEWPERFNFFNNIFGSPPYAAQDALFVAVAGVFMLWAPRLLKSSINRTLPAALIPMAAVLLVWLAAPAYTMKTNYIFQRFALFILPFYALMFCRPASPSHNEDITQSRACQLVLAMLCWLLLAGHTERLLRFAQESREFEVVRTAVEPGQRALSLVLESSSTAAKNQVAYLHHPLWYQAENGGFVDYNFAWAPSQMVRFREDQLPAVLPFWNPERFSWMDHRGGDYRYFFVRHAQPLPSEFFRNDQCAVSLLKSSGHWSVFEATRCRPH